LVQEKYWEEQVCDKRRQHNNNNNNNNNNNKNNSLVLKNHAMNDCKNCGGKTPHIIYPGTRWGEISASPLSHSLT
jgi:hypothetical protein